MDAYHELAQSYDRLTSDVDYAATVDFCLQILKRENLNPRTAVDLACGTGSVTALLAQLGMQVIGVDMSEEMLCQASQKAERLTNRPIFICQQLHPITSPRWKPANSRKWVANSLCPCPSPATMPPPMATTRVGFWSSCRQIWINSSNFWHKNDTAISRCVSY